MMVNANRFNVWKWNVAKQQWINNRAVFHSERKGIFTHTMQRKLKGLNSCVVLKQSMGQLAGICWEQIWTPQHWKKVTWSEESRFTLFQNEEKKMMLCLLDKPAGAVLWSRDAVVAQAQVQQQNGPKEWRHLTAWRYWVILSMEDLFSERHIPRLGFQDLLGSNCGSESTRHHFYAWIGHCRIQTIKNCWDVLQKLCSGPSLPHTRSWWKMNARLEGNISRYFSLYR